MKVKRAKTQQGNWAGPLSHGCALLPEVPEVLSKNVSLSIYDSMSTE